MTSPAPASTELARVYAAVDYLSDLEGQDRTLVIEMSQAMIEGRGLSPLVDYIARYCDVIGSRAEAEQIAADI